MADFGYSSATTRATWPTLLMATIGVIVSLLGLLMASGVLAYWEGLSNGSRSMRLYLYALLGGLFFVTAVVMNLTLAISKFRRASPVARQPFIGAVISIAAVIPAYFLGMRPDDAFEAGFVRWTISHVDVNATLAWTTRLPPTTTASVPVMHQGDPPEPSESLRSEWPPHILGANPERVTRLVNGVMLEWGAFATWGDCRRVFVATDEQANPNGDPENLHFHFKQIRPRLWLAVQATG